MSKKKNKKFKRWLERREKRPGRFALPQETKQMIFGVLMILIGIIISLGFFEKAGRAGLFFMKASRLLIGETVFLVPLIFILGGLIFLNRKVMVFGKEKKFFWPVFLAIFILILGITGILGSFSKEDRSGGWLGFILSWPFLKYFGFLVAELIFLALTIIGGLIFWQLLTPHHFLTKEEKLKLEKEKIKEEKPLITRIFKKVVGGGPKFKIKEIIPLPPTEMRPLEQEVASLKMETKPIISTQIFSYQPPPFDLLEPDKGSPNSGDTRINSAIIKKTLQNFGIEVIMSEINIGPTVTQYTLKPTEGVKLSKITALSNDLALALASHPIRIEAPVPGRSLVGIEVPNKVRAQVRLRNLIEDSNFQKSFLNLLISLGRDVSGLPVFADLTRMPHLLVAGSTGTGKTIFLNSLILSLLYQPTNTIKSAGPETLRFILVDPKRVEFPVYNSLPHLLCPVIYSASQAITILKWLTLEMERRFDLLSEVKARDISSFNEIALKQNKKPLPFIILIIDELADLMAAKGREVEAGIVRLAQMARAVGIHLIIATQRPSVEVITGLIKANITSRITFQVASQVDSRTVLDTGGAEKLLGSGDMLYISAEVVKPKRIQGAYVSEKEVRRVVKYIVSTVSETGPKTEIENELFQELEKDSGQIEKRGLFYTEEDPIYEEAKKIVIEARKASASLLQRRLRIGYARAARLIDILEERGMVGPGEGAKPREVYGEKENEEFQNLPQNSRNPEPEDEEKWEKI